ncbi:hypothetical protein BO83DRAFT_461185 [Aspergillus eucalypticola CBS 122712]|uniref:Zn(II)2Cys6 transcription factor n=1 Tax=Aspergillus eucalypticola (strain CBS 122712 / IBT 29274) TaxID=1448314 RepID=A0A317VXE7_ASPEC|nr:uncharacterized protein BO83DRAFT_461185 [Aspergillus eucalypticola CBS 122712]PWY78943.1 hypothetical protein BO83DRAFT_461185 [Aspergillus eucalypticola CBS 122712]
MTVCIFWYWRILGNNLIHNGAIQEVSEFLWRKRKALRCDRQHLCGACKRRKRESICSYEAPAGPSVSRKTRRKPVTTSASSALSNGAGSPATPRRKGANSSISQPEQTISEVEISPPGVHWETVLERPVPEDVSGTLSPLSISPRISLQVIDSLPPKSCCDYLVSHLFKYFFAFFPTLHGPTFQKQYTAFMQRPQDVDLPWLAVLFALCSLSLNTLDESDPRLKRVWSQLPSSITQAASTVPITVSVSRRLLRTAITCLLQGDFLMRHTISTFEALLMVVYSLFHNESFDQGWALLGMTLNIGIAECFPEISICHTFSAFKIPLPADGIVQKSFMMAKLRLFRLSTQICRHTSGSSRLDQQALPVEQERWDAAYMVDGSPNILGSNRYAYWCVLQTYAHHLYLLLQRPFHLSKASCFFAISRERQLYEAPILRNYFWLLSGVMTVALNSCLQDDTEHKLESFREEIEIQAGAGEPPAGSSETPFQNLSEDLKNIREWMDADLVDWNMDGQFNVFAP